MWKLLHQSRGNSLSFAKGATSLRTYVGALRWRTSHLPPTHSILSAWLRYKTTHSARIYRSFGNLNPAPEPSKKRHCPNLGDSTTLRISKRSLMRSAGE